MEVEEDRHQLAALVVLVVQALAAALVVLVDHH
jgi:hypothetical protein